MCIVFLVTETVRYTYRLRPGARAAAALVSEWNRCRFLWNEAVHQQKTGQRPTLCGLSKLLTDARGKFAWLREGSQVAQQQMLRNYSQSLNQSFKVQGRGRPKFKARKRVFPSLDYTTRGFSIRDASPATARWCEHPRRLVPGVAFRSDERQGLPRFARPLVRVVRGPPRGGGYCRSAGFHRDRLG
jgi:transposase